MLRGLEERESHRRPKKEKSEAAIAMRKDMWTSKRVMSDGAKMSDVC